jgi:hypothetical protein
MEERIIAADPVAEPLEYQRELLALLGGRDPVEVLATTPTTVRERAAGVPDEVLTRRPEPREWSAAEVLGHLWDAEVIFAGRARLILAQPEPKLIGYDQDAWSELPRPPFAVLLDAFAALRTADVLLARATPEPDWERAGVHEERGPTSFGLLLREIAGHDIAHLRQFEQTLAAVSR